MVESWQIINSLFYLICAVYLFKDISFKTILLRAIVPITIGRNIMTLCVSCKRPLNEHVRENGSLSRLNIHVLVLIRIWFSSCNGSKLVLFFGDHYMTWLN